MVHLRCNQAQLGMFKLINAAGFNDTASDYMQLTVFEGNTSSSLQILRRQVWNHSGGLGLNCSAREQEQCSDLKDNVPVQNHVCAQLKSPLSERACRFSDIKYR